jgi:hypothetical protein
MATTRSKPVSKAARAKRDKRELCPEFREFLERCVLPALVEKFFAEHEQGKKRSDR